MSLVYNELTSREHIEKIRAYNDTLGSAVAVIKTFGCQQNEADSEKIAGILMSLGYRISDSAEEADLIILNTCAVRAHAEEKVLSLLGAYKAYKRKKPSLIIGVVGCMGAVEKTVDTLKRDFHYVSFTLGAGVMYRLPEVLFGCITDGKRRFVAPEACEPVVEQIPTSRTPGPKAYVSIMYGCNNFCSYCIVPYTRGRERSRASADILAECRELVAGGVGEIMLLGQNVNSYFADMNFPELLSAVAGISGEFKIRFMTSHPKDVSDELIAVMRDNPDKIAPIFHLPLQSGSDRILLDMNRKYDKAKFIETANKLKAAIPNLAITTDVIVGYPGESEADFAETLDVLATVEFDAVYAFLYSARSGTRAALRTDTVPEEQKSERIGRLLRMQDEISLRKNGALVGKTLPVFIDSEQKSLRKSGRLANGKLVHFDAADAPAGSYINVKITKAEPYSLIGEAVK